MGDVDETPKKFLATQPPDHLSNSEGGEGYPSLLNLRVYVADRRNATTAYCAIEGGDGRRIQLTVCAARPPQVSYLCVFCPGFESDVFAAPPYIVTTEADLLLLALFFGPYSARYKPENYQYYVYQAAGPGGAPWLQLIPRPGPSFDQVLSSPVTGILRYSSTDHPEPKRRNRRRRRADEQKDSNFILRPHDGHQHQHDGSDSYIISAICYTGSTNHFELHVYHSRTKTWSSKLVIREHDPEQQPFHQSHKVITIGGNAGTMAWVDLWNGILFYDLLGQDDDKGRTFGRYVPLPPTPLAGDQLDGCPLGERDIALINGRIRYIELQTHVGSSKSARQHCTYVSYGWTAFMWSRSAADPHPSWRPDCKLKASEVSEVGDNKLPDVESLPRLEEDEGEPRPTMARLHCGHPTLSLLDDQVFYLMNKIDFRDKKAWVLAVNTRNKALQAVAEFTADRVSGFSFTYRHSRLSEYLKTAPGPNGGLKQSSELMMNLHGPRTMEIAVGGQYHSSSAHVEGDEDMLLD